MGKLKKTMTESLEDYIEMIYILSEKSGGAQVRDIAKNLHITMPSVVKAIKELSALELVTHEPYAVVKMTEKGIREARFVLGRHHLLKKFLRLLGVSEAAAERDACLMEHDLSVETIERIRKFTEKKEKEKAAKRTAARKEDK
jgi:DtxR family Mn-dependent transcriptional regulator